MKPVHHRTISRILEKLIYSFGTIVSSLRGYRGAELAWKVKLVGKGRIKIGVGTKVFPYTILNTSGSPFASVFKKGLPAGYIEIGENCRIKGNVTIITYQSKIVIGNNVTINPFTTIFGSTANICIGNDVLIATGTTIVASNHSYDNLNIPIRNQGARSIGITIKDNVWIGAGAKILDGVTIEEGAIIAAGAVVNRDIEQNAVAVGVPAKVIKYRDGDIKNS